MARTVLESLRLTAPKDAERDPAFREDLLSHIKIGMRVAGMLGVGGTAAWTAGQMLFRHMPFQWALDGRSGTVSLWFPLIDMALSAGVFLLSFSRRAREWGRVITGVLAVAVLMASVTDYLAAGIDHPSRHGMIALVMLVAIGTMPYRAGQTLALGLITAFVYAVGALAIPGLFGHNPINLIPEFPIFVAILIGMCTGISAMIYAGRWDAYRARHEERELRRVLSDSEQRYRALFEDASDGIFEYSDIENGFTMVNPVIERLLGMSAAELARTPFTEVIHPDDLERVVRIHKARLSGEEAPMRYTLKLRRRGSDVPIVCEMTLHQSDDLRITRGAVRDITEHMRMEEQIQILAQLPEKNPFPVIRFDRDGRLLYKNAAARNFPAEIGRPDLTITDLLPPDTPARVKRLIETNTTIIDGRHDVHGRTLSVTYRPLPDSQQIFVWLVDVTERIRAEERIRAYATRLENANRELREMQSQLVQTEKMAALGNLVAGVAHEINTPLGSIHANADVSRRALDIVRTSHAQGLCHFEPEAAPRLQRAIEILDEANMTTRTATDRIVRIVRSLRNFARLDEAEVKEVDIHEGLESTLTLVYHEYKNRIEIERDFGHLPPVRCYPNQLNQVFMNILVNAIHAIPGEGKITIGTRALGDQVEISFTDTGVGIAPENLDRIFDPGFTTKGVGIGTGLGLSIVYKIIEAHHGRVEVESKVGQGTTFRLILPVQIPESEGDRETKQ